MISILLQRTLSGRVLFDEDHTFVLENGTAGLSVPIFLAHSTPTYLHMVWIRARRDW